MKKPLISIIIPIYNAEKTLKKCIDSIIDQSYTNLEIILINDGSTDNSYKICLEYQSKDDRVIVINKPNSGVSSTRNFGLDFFHGDYVGFVDSDDYIDKDMYDNLYTNIVENNSDVSICNYYIYSDSKYKKNVEGISKVFYGSKQCVESLLNKNIGWTNWNKLYSKKVVSNIRFRENLNMGEDGIFNIDICDNNDEIVFSYFDKYLYYYYFVNNKEKYNKKINDYFDFLQIIIDKMEKYYISSIKFKVDYVCNLNKYLFLQKKYKDINITNIQNREEHSKKYFEEIKINKINIKYKVKLFLSKYLINIYSIISR